MTDEAILAVLWENDGDFVSGAELARQLGVSRTAVWKGVERLRSAGYGVESVTNRGYRLSGKGDVLSAAGIARHLKNAALRVEYYPVIGSTNTVLKERAASGAPHGLVIVAGEQTGGRGRMGRQFYSPAGTGLYMSLLLRPERSAAESTMLTAAAAVAVAESVEALSGRKTEIKWVNDVLIDGKKICGILTEASVDWESGMADYVVVGIGVNTRLPAGDFPEELRAVAGAVFRSGEIPELRCRLAAAILDRLTELYESPDSEECYRAYRERSSVLGRDINILSPGREPVRARVLDIQQDYSLLVRLTDGTQQRVNAGEVSIRPGE